MMLNRMKVFVNIARFFLILLISIFMLFSHKVLYAACSSETPTPTSTSGFFWGTVKVGGKDGQVGYEIRAFVDSVEINGGCVGYFKVNTLGFYGSMPIYEDDPTTTEKDGVKDSDTIYFKICHNGTEHRCNETYIWDSPELVELNLTIDCQLPKADFIADPNSRCAPLSVQFSNRSTYGDNYSWDFGDGIISTDTNPIHVYSSSGSFTVKLMAFNDCGSDINEEYIYISNFSLYFRDADGDGYGDPDLGSYQCEELDGFVANDNDCDDSNYFINPGNLEIRNMAGEIKENFEIGFNHVTIDPSCFQYSSFNFLKEERIQNKLLSIHKFHQGASGKTSSSYWFFKKISGDSFIINSESAYAVFK